MALMMGLVYPQLRWIMREQATRFGREVPLDVPST